MGRGDQHEQQASSRGLLFGPRRAKELDPQRQKEMKHVKRRRASDARKTSHRQALEAAETALIQGDAQPMLAFLSEKAPHGTVEAERLALRDMAVRLRQAFRQTPPPPTSVESLTALQQLRQRAQDRRLPNNRQELLRSAFVAHANQLIGNETTELFERHAEEIGELPRVWLSGRNSRTHLRDPGSGRLLCGEDFEQNDSPWNAIAANGEATPLVYDISCDDCLSRYKAGATAMSYSPNEWLEQWHQHNDRITSSLEHQVMRIFGWRGPPPTTSAPDAHQLLRRRRLEGLQSALEACGHRLPAAMQAED